ncbi:MAG: methyltransferase domain-containing protein, partial [Sporichthyaceae bacterium]|nr:methyltransferase domain-containing protein [Sporichthyaceae bacterium]
GQDWAPHARWLADRLALPESRWHQPIATTPRHLLAPRWFTRTNDTGDLDGLERWMVHDGATDEAAWLQAAYHQTCSLVTQVAGHHADLVTLDERPTGLPTSSATNPWTLMQMLRHGRIARGCTVLDVGTGPGYACALLARLLGEERVTSVDLDPYLTTAAAERLDRIGLHPQLRTADATGPLDWQGDRIVATVAVRKVPASWLVALRPAGRLVATIADTMCILTARKTDDGGAWGQVQYDRAGFMTARTSLDPPQPPKPGPPEPSGDGEATAGRYPVLDVARASELASMLAITAPGIRHGYHQDGDGQRTAWMTHPDGSWAKATGRDPGEHVEGRDPGEDREECGWGGDYREETA